MLSKTLFLVFLAEGLGGGSRAKTKQIINNDAKHKQDSEIRKKGT